MLVKRKGVLNLEQNKRWKTSLFIRNPVYQALSNGKHDIKGIE